MADRVINGASVQVIQFGENGTDKWAEYTDGTKKDVSEGGMMALWNVWASNPFGDSIRNDHDGYCVYAYRNKIS